MERYRRKRLEAMGRRILDLQAGKRSLEFELRATRAALQQARWRIEALEKQLEKERSTAARAKAQLAELAQSLKEKAPPATLPIAYKANVPQAPKRPPGQKAGHVAAHRPMPTRIDSHIQVPL